MKIVGFVPLALLSILARTAAAQTISVANEATLPRVDAQGNQLAKRVANLTPEAVSFQDCVDDQRIRLALTLGDFQANASLQVWAANSGQDCSVATARAGGGQQCWMVTDSDVPLATTTQVDVPVRRILSGVTPFGPTPGETDATENACGKVDLANISLQLLYFSPGNLSQAAVDHAITVVVDTVGPAAPTGLSVLSGNRRIQVRFDNISGGDPDAGVTGGLTELTGVNAYCDVSRTVTTLADASCTTGDADDADAAAVCGDAGVDTTNACTSVDLTTTTTPDADFAAAHLCGSFAGNSGTTVSATTLGGQELQNGVTYAVAVAATDKYGNVGPLSGILCEIPEETTDFWESYKQADGDAGCETTRAAPLGSTTALLGVGVAAFVRRRRHRRGRKEK